MLTVAPSTAWPSLVSGFILKDRDSSSATWPNPEPAGVSARTRHSRTDPEAATMQERVAEPLRSCTALSSKTLAISCSVGLRSQVGLRTSRFGGGEAAMAAG